MAMLMGPPMTPGYSLRVQLFAPNSHSLNDTPIRCFRVVTSPDVTLRLFCQEASRIHEINYGKPISIKKCQDEQGFDVTQNDILGPLFNNAATIRIIQASTVAGIRDSVPPTSALRYDPPGTASRKRDRGGSASPHGSGPSNLWRSSKRQRVSGLDPDEPLPTLERDIDTLGYGPQFLDDYVVPDSQGEAIALNKGQFDTHSVRPNVPRVSETPRPSPPLRSSPPLRLPTDRQPRKSAISNLQGSPTLMPPIPPVRTESYVSNSSESKTGSYRIVRPTERVKSVSTTATSPVSADQQLPPLNEFGSSNKHKKSDPFSNVRQNGTKGSTSPNEDSIYENIESEREDSSGLRRTKKLLKIRNSPRSGLHGLNWANNLATPVAGNRRGSSSEKLSTPRELPLTPESRNRRESEKLESAKEEARSQDEIRAESARSAAAKAAAKAAEHRRRVAEKERRDEEVRLKEEQEHLESQEAAARKEAEDKEATTVAKAEKQRKEREVKHTKVEDDRAAEDKRRELERLKKEKEAAEILRTEQEWVKAAQRLRECEEKEEANNMKQAAATPDTLRKSKDMPEGVKKRSSISEPTEPPKTKILPRDHGPAALKPVSRPQSSTPLIPLGRKMPLPTAKPTMVSEYAVGSSSPEVSRTSPANSSKGIGIKEQVSLPKGRRVSFREDVEEILISTPTIAKVTPTKVSLPKASTSKISLSEIVPPKKQSHSSIPVSTPSIVKVSAPKASTSKVSLSQVVPPEKQSHTPIPLPPAITRTFSKERSNTPLTQTKILPPRSGMNRKSSVKGGTPEVVVRQPLPATSVQGKKNVTPIGSQNAKEKSKSVESARTEPTTINISSDDESSDSESNDEGLDRIHSPMEVVPAETAARVEIPVPSQAIAHKPDTEKNELQGIEVASDRSYSRESRSPVVFNRHTAITSQHSGSLSLVTQDSSPSPDSTSVSADGDDESADVDEQSDDENSEEEGRSEDEDIEDRAGHEIPQANGKANLTSREPKIQRKMPTEDSEDDLSTQDEIDQQLTSSMYEVQSSLPITPTPRPSSTVKARPALRIGASLSSLNSNKPIYNNAATKNLAIGKTSMLPKLIDSLSDEEGSTDESNDSSSDSASDERSDKKQPRARLDAQSYAAILNHQLKAAKPKDKRDGSTTDSDSSSENSGDEERDEDEDEEALRNELAAQIAQMANGDS